MRDAPKHQNTNTPNGEGVHQSTNAPTHQNTNSPKFRRLRLTVSISEDIYKVVSDRAIKLRTSKGEVMEELLRAGIRETANFIRLMKELNTPIDALIKAYKEEFDMVAGLKIKHVEILKEGESGYPIFNDEEVDSVVLERID
jgi:hypothetical protein